LFERLNVDAEKFGLGVPAATVSVIQYTGAEKINPAEVFVHLGTALLDAKQNAQKAFKVYRASELSLTGEGEYLRWLADQMIDRMVVLGAMLDESNRLAYTDQVTGLPNMRAAQQQLERQLAQAVAENGTISVLLIDGDDLREYNKISYAAGDAMIQRLGAILDDNLRPGDFLARWRIGDEFLVILPGTPTGQAEMVGERLCRAIQGASQEWPIPITISIGIASYPDFTSAGILLEEAEQANREAKEEGKNRVVISMQK
jgi:diguanylate cyclase (GGDEF)-like protein